MSKKILVIDDEELLTKTFTRLLEKNGYEVYTAKNGSDAKVLAEEEAFDLIICDIRIPGKNGVEIIREIQPALAEKDKNKIPVIFLTGFADSKLEREAQALDPIAYIFKPFDVGKLLEVIESTVGIS